MITLLMPQHYGCDVKQAHYTLQIKNNSKISSANFVNASFMLLNYEFCPLLNRLFYPKKVVGDFRFKKIFKNTLNVVKNANYTSQKR